MTNLFSPRPSKSGFTLIEMLIVCALISLLASLVFPVFQSARQKAYDVKCTSNLRQIGMAIAQYADDYDDLYPARSRDFFDGHCFASSWGLPATEIQAMPLLSATLASYAKVPILFRDPMEQGFTDDDNGGACKASADLVGNQPMTLVQRTELSIPQAKLLSHLSQPASIDVLHTFSPWRKGWTLVLHADGHVKGMDRTSLVQLSQTSLNF